MSKRRKKGKGDWSLPGYNFIGPGNPLDNAEPTSRGDQLALTHDKEYEKLIQQKMDPYYNWNQADEDFLNGIQNEWSGKNIKNTYGEFLGHTFFHGKRKAHQMGLIGNVGPTIEPKAPETKQRLRGKPFEVTLDSTGNTLHDNRANIWDPTITNLATMNTRPGEATAQPGLQATLGAAAPAGGAVGVGGETPVDPVGYEKIRPWADTVNVIMPYRTGGALSIQSNPAGVDAITFRLNSIYDVVTSSAYTADPPPAADTFDTNINKPMWYNYYTSIYKYWTVTKSTYKMRIWISGRDAANVGSEVSVWTYHHGQQQPPLLNETVSAKIPDIIRKVHPNNHKTTIRSLPLTTLKSRYDDNTYIHGMYMPGPKYVKNEVAEDDFHETWHKATEVPSLREAVTFIVQRSDMMDTLGNTSSTIALNYEFEIQYHTQFKNLKTAFKYTTQDTDMNITDMEVQTL